MVDTGATAWVLTSAALVLLMTPGLALFYGGMVRPKSVLNMMMMSFGALGVVGVLWTLWGYSMAFGDDVGLGLLGNPGQYFGLKGLMADTTTDAGGLPAMAFVGFQAVFAIITVALISGAIADRVKFSTWMVFAAIWATVVYFPVAHWVFDFSLDAHVGGWIANNLKAIDFAGGTAVHINAGTAGLVLAIVVGKRRGFGREPMRPHNLPLVMLGAGLLWFGWFGFNAGSALAANNSAAVVWVNTLVATCAAILGWLAHRALPRRPRHLPGRRLRCRRRPGGHHPGLLRAQPRRVDHHRRHRRRALRAGGRPEVQVRLRRLPGRRRRPPRRRPVGHDLHRLPRHRERAGGDRRALLRRRSGPALAPGRRGAGGPAVQRRRHAGDRPDPQGRHGLAHRRRGRGLRHRPGQHAESGYDLVGSIGGGHGQSFNPSAAVAAPRPAEEARA